MNLREAVNRIRSSGHRLTPQRLEILQVLITMGAPASAQAVLQHVQKTYPCISLDTVYRNLTMLTNTGLVSHINLQNKGTALFEFQGEAHHHHAVCLVCSKSFCIDSCPLPESVPLPASDRNFRVVSHAFELYGYCSHCHARLPDA